MSDYTDKVRKLLAQAEDAGATEEEREAFRAKAYELMAREMITEAMLKGAPPPEEITCIQVKFDNPWGRERRDFICSLARTFGCRPVITAFKPHKGYVTVCGSRGDLEAFQLSHTSLDLQLPFAIKKYQAPDYLTGWEKYVERRDFVIGWCDRVTSRCREMLAATRKTIVTEAADAAGEEFKAVDERVSLALRDVKAQVDDFIDKKFGKLHNMRGGPRVGGNSGYGAGTKAGNSASVGASKSFHTGPKGIGSGK